MRFCYAYRRWQCYPRSLSPWDLHPEAFTDEHLARVARMGFDGIEIGSEVLDRTGGTEKDIRGFGERVADAGAPIASIRIVSIRAGGSFVDPTYAKANRDRQNRAIDYAGWLGAEVVNNAITSPHRYDTPLAMAIGRPKSLDSSRGARMSEYEALAKICRAACDRAADRGVTLAVEVHQNSQVDNSRSALLLNKMVDRDNFGINPDLGNVTWTYDVPEETPEDAIRAMAPEAVYWHCKNVQRVYHPENRRAVFLPAALPDGDIDYRFAVEAMHDAGYEGYTVIEGALGSGDQFHIDQKSLDYMKGIWAELEA